MSILTERTVLFGKIESTFNEDPQPSAALDAFLASEVAVTMDANVLERNNYTPSLSNDAIKIGRKLVGLSFTHEVKASGNIAVAPRLGRLFRACGMSQTWVAAGSDTQIGSATRNPANTSSATLSLAKDTAPTGNYYPYVLEYVSATEAVVTTTGNDTTVLRNLVHAVSVTSASGTASVAVTAGEPTYTLVGPFVADDAVFVTVGGILFQVNVTEGNTTPTAIATAIADKLSADARLTANSTAGVIAVTLSAAAGAQTIDTNQITLGASGAQVTVTETGSPDVADRFEVDVLRTGWHYDPVSDGFESMTFYVFYDGLMHKITGCRGTFSVSAESGNFATASFTFTGQYYDPIDKALPSAELVLEASEPQQVELAQFALGNYSACAQSFSFDISNTVTPRTCINAKDGFEGVRITSRAPTGGVNPEAVLPSEFAVWRSASEGRSLYFEARVGTQAGNIIQFEAPAAQISAAPYGDRDGDRTYELSLRLAGASPAGNDELRIVAA